MRSSAAHGLTRALIADADWPAKARNVGPSGTMAEHSPLTVAGAAAALCASPSRARTAFPFDPLREPPFSNLDGTRELVKRRDSVALRRSLMAANGPFSSFRRVAQIWSRLEVSGHWPRGPRSYLGCLSLTGFIQTVVADKVVLGGGTLTRARLAPTDRKECLGIGSYAAACAIRRECIGVIETFPCELIGCNISCSRVPQKSPRQSKNAWGLL
jgi:hypothetical protein